MNKNFVVIILVVLLIGSAAAAVYFALSGQKAEAPAAVPAVATPGAASDQSLCAKLPLYTGPSGDGSSGLLYPYIAQDICYIVFAAEKNEPVLCKEIKGLAEVRTACYAALAIKSGNEVACESAPLDAQDRCYSEIARQLGSVAVCDKIKQVFERDNCYSNFATRVGDVEICKKITTANSRDSCYFNLAQNLRDSALCDKITQGGMRQDCRTNISR